MEYSVVWRNVSVGVRVFRSVWFGGCVLAGMRVRTFFAGCVQVEGFDEVVHCRFTYSVAGALRGAKRGAAQRSPGSYPANKVYEITPGGPVCYVTVTRQQQQHICEEATECQGCAHG